MNAKNTFSKGDIFEKKTYELLKLVLENEDFYVSGKKSKIYHKKGYYSSKRQSDIIFDIAIETYLDKSKDYSLLTLIECKSYTSPIPVNDLEEFDAKIRQIGEHNIKAIVISDNAFQSGAHDFAKSSGIGLVRINNNDEFEWIVTRKASDISPLKLADGISILETQEARPASNILAINDQFILTNLADLLIQIGIIDFFKLKEKFIVIPFITKERIDQIVSKLEKYDLFTGDRLDDKKLCEFLESKYAVTFDFASDLEKDVLGKITFDPLQIMITNSVRVDVNRWRFTLAHEIGHLILHSAILKNKIAEKTDNDFSLSYKYAVSETISRRMEFQANLFASHLLLPMSSLQRLVTHYFAEERINKGHLYWDHQPVNQQLVFGLLTRISMRYNVSIEVARIRLIALGWLIDDRFATLRGILKEMKLA